MQICFFVQNHLGAAHASRLIRALRRSPLDAFVLVGHDEFAGHGSAAELARALDVDVFATRAPAKRGYFSLLDPYFDAVEWLAERSVSYDWLVYLSGQDYPTRPLAALAELLAGTDGDAFLRHWCATDAVNPWRRRHQGEMRYLLQYADAPAWTLPLLRLARVSNGWQRLVHVHLTYGPRVGVRRRHPFDASFRCWAGPQWTVLRRACAESVTARVRRGGALIDWFRRTVSPDEAVVQTLLVNDGRFRIVNDDLRYADLSESVDGRPRVLSTADLAELTSGPYYFARKFDRHRSAGLIDLLDERIG